ncbi:MAG: SUMF1/EgtB/PvdO family nonheme iron enzyme [Caldilineaceae bacterium]
MSEPTRLKTISNATASIIGPPFVWCWVSGGKVELEDASHYGLKHEGTVGGVYQVASFAMAKYPITNAQYQRFISAPNGQSNPHWWSYSAQAAQWRKDRPQPRPTAFAGANVSRTRVSWFDSMAFCAWLSCELASQTGGELGRTFDTQDITTWCVRLPTEQEWQRAAVGDTGWPYSWGNELDESCANYGNQVGRPIDVGSYPSGQSVYGVMDLVGNLWEWCLTRWGEESIDVNGYIYRAVKGGAWNVANPEYLRAIDRNGWGPRGLLNDGGFRCSYHELDHGL